MTERLSLHLLNETLQNFHERHSVYLLTIPQLVIVMEGFKDIDYSERNILNNVLGLF